MPDGSWSPDIDLFGDGDGVVDFDAEIPHRALELGVTEEQLDRPEVSSPPIDERSFGPPHGVRSIGGRIKADRGHPPADKSGVLPCADRVSSSTSAGKQAIARPTRGFLDPRGNGISRLFRQLELNGSFCLFLDDDCS
jgi:hypothetical protein